MKTVSTAILRREFAALRDAINGLGRTLERLSVGTALVRTPNGRLRQRKALTPKRRASLVLQGRYMGYMRQLKPRQKAQVRRVKEAKGVMAAIKSARAFRSQ